MYDIFRPSEHTSPIARVIYDKFSEVQERRSSNKNWIEDEVIFLWEETCRQRSMLGKVPVSLEEVKKVERMAQGHIDYPSKCALYCQELVNAD